MGGTALYRHKVCLKRRIKWVVGNEKDICVWKDQLLGSKPATSTTSATPIHCPQLRVCELFTENTTEWNVQLIKSLFNDQDASNILAYGLASSISLTSLFGRTQKMVITVLNLGITYKGKSQPRKVNKILWQQKRLMKLKKFAQRCGN